MIENKILNITDTDVAECDNKVLLLSWQNSIDLQRLGIRQKIHKEYGGKIACDKAKKLNYALEIQGILRSNIQARLTELKEIRKSAFDRLFMLQGKLLYPDIFNELTVLVNDEINN